MTIKLNKKMAVLAGAAFIIMLLLNCLTPYLADDFTFSYSFADRDTLHSPYILVRSAYYHYFEWSGRIIVKFFAQLFTLPPKPVFDAINAGAFTLLGLTLCHMGDTPGIREENRPITLAFAFLSMWLISPVFGQVNLWMCGSCNNLWSTLGCVAFLLPWRHLFTDISPHGKFSVPLFFVGGLFAGWLYENTSAGMLFCMVLCFLWALLQKRKIPGWAVSAFLGSCLGYALLLLAPGNSVRTDDSSAAVSYSIWEYVSRFKKATIILIKFGWPLLLFFAVLLVFLFFVQRVQLVELAFALILFLSGIAANYAMIGSPVYYLRSSHGPFTLLTAACCVLLSKLEPKALKKAACLCGAAGVLSLVLLVFAFYDIAQYRNYYDGRDREIRAAVAQGETQIVTYAIEPNTRFCGAWGLPDIRESEDWISMTRCMWYGLDGLGLRTGEQATITADSSAPLKYPPLMGLPIGSGEKD